MNTSNKHNNCQHQQTTIVVLESFAAFEVIGYQCTECKEIIKKVKQ